MGLSVTAGAAFHFFGHDYAEGDVIDTTSWSQKAVAELLSHYPVYVNAPGGGGGGGAPSIAAVAAAGAAQTLTVGASAQGAFDLTGSAASCALTFAGGVAGKMCQWFLTLRQDATGGRAWTFPAGAHWAAGAAPALSTAPGRWDELEVRSWDGGATFTVIPHVIGALVPAAPDAPAAPTIQQGDGTLWLSWTWPSSNGSPLTGFEIWRGTAAGGEAKVATVGLVAAYQDPGLANGTTYYYTIKAINAVGASAASAEASAAPVAAAGGRGVRSVTLPGTSGNYVDAPNSATNRMAAQTKFSMVGKITPTRWASGTNQAIVGMWGASGTALHYLLWLNTGGQPVASWSNGTTAVTATCPVGTGFADNTAGWLRCDVNMNNAGGWSATFYTSADGVKWDLLSTVTSATGGEAGGLGADTAKTVEAGSSTAGTANLFAGKIEYVEVISGDYATGAVVVSADFSAQAAGAASFVGGAGATWTMHGTAAIA